MKDQVLGGRLTNGLAAGILTGPSTGNPFGLGGLGLLDGVGGRDRGTIGDLVGTVVGGTILTGIPTDALGITISGNFGKVTGGRPSSLSEIDGDNVLNLNVIGAAVKGVARLGWELTEGK